ncbi:MAG: hypothetical protein DRQ78_11225 [Epsilonproteobacteria bacterium]|nr:MAG: hypothetical protein DRQ78_11225 [Campylobacterota bacterium]
MLNKDSGQPIQGMPLGRGNATSPYTVQSTDNVIEFTEAGDVTCTLADGTTPITAVLAGARYSISNGVTIITFTGTFSVG